MELASGIQQALVSESGLIASSPLANAFQDGSSMHSCVHFWVIDSPNGPTSSGMCKLCGEIREFRNSIYSSTWSRGMVKRDNGWEAI